MRKASRNIDFWWGDILHTTSVLIFFRPWKTQVLDAYEGSNGQWKEQQGWCNVGQLYLVTTSGVCHVEHAQKPHPPSYVVVFSHVSGRIFNSKILSWCVTFPISFILEKSKVHTNTSSINSLEVSSGMYQIYWRLPVTEPLTEYLTCIHFKISGVKHF